MFDPRDDAALDVRHPPSGELLADALRQVVAALPQVGAATGQDLLVVGHHLGDDQLLEDRGAEVAREAGAGHPLDEVALGTHPSDAQAAPDRLADRSDDDDVAGDRERRGPVLAVEAESGHRLVDDEGRPLALGEFEHAGARVASSIVLPVGFWNSGIR